MKTVYVKTRTTYKYSLTPLGCDEPGPLLQVLDKISYAHLNGTTRDVF